MRPDITYSVEKGTQNPGSDLGKYFEVLQQQNLQTLNLSLILDTAADMGEYYRFTY